MYRYVFCVSLCLIPNLSFGVTISLIEDATVSIAKFGIEHFARNLETLPNGFRLGASRNGFAETGDLMIVDNGSGQLEAHYSVLPSLPGSNFNGTIAVGRRFDGMSISVGHSDGQAVLWEDGELREAFPGQPASGLFHVSSNGRYVVGDRGFDAVVLDLSDDSWLTIPTLGEQADALFVNDFRDVVLLKSAQFRLAQFNSGSEQMELRDNPVFSLDDRLDLYPGLGRYVVGANMTKTGTSTSHGDLLFLTNLSLASTFGDDTQIVEVLYDPSTELDYVSVSTPSGFGLYTVDEFGSLTEVATGLQGDGIRIGLGSLAATVISDDSLRVLRYQVSVPEPGSALLFGVAILALFGFRRMF